MLKMVSSYFLQHNHKGATLYRLKRFDEALTAYEQALQISPDDAFVYNGLGNIFLALRRYQEALTAYEQAIFLEPYLLPAYNGRGNTLYNLRRYGEALNAYEQAIALAPHIALLYSNKGNTLRNLSRHEEALSAYELAISLAPNKAIHCYHKGIALFRLGRYEEALTAYKRAIELAPNYAAAFVGKGTTLQQMSKYKLALTAYEEAIALAPNYADAFVGKGTTLQQMSKYKLALTAYEEAIALASNNVAAHNGKGNALHALRRYKASLGAYEETMALDPRFTSAYVGKGNALYELKRYDEAIHTYEQATFLDPKNISAYIGKGNALYHVQRFTEAVQAYEQVLLLDPACIPAYNGKGDALRNLRYYEAALETYQRAIDLNPDNASAYSGKGMIFHEIKRYEEALVAYEQAISFDLTSSLVYCNRGNTFYELKRYEEALVDYEQAIKLTPRQATFHYSKGLALENLRRYNEALASYKQAIHLDAHLESTGSPGLIGRFRSIQEFLRRSGFEFNDVIAPGFLAVARTSVWHERFPAGLYIRILFDRPLDQGTVRDIHIEAKASSNCALVIINQQPEISGWMAIAGLRLEKSERFVLLPIAESLIREGTALNQEHQILNVYVKKHLGSDFDPYDVRYPVSDAVSFFGRESVTDEIINALQMGQSLGLFGLHKMGKSSVLQRLQKKSDFPAAYVYLSRGDSLEGIYKRILKGWSREIRIKYPHVHWPVPQITSDSDAKMTFDSAARELLTQLGSVTNTPLLAIFLDEIEHIVPSQENDEKTLQTYITLMDSLRGLQQETNNVSLLVAGIHPSIVRRNYFLGNQKNPLHQVISERFLFPLDSEDCNYMLRSLGQQVNLTYDDEALAYIIQKSGAHPFLARQLCSLAYKNRGSLDIISLPMVEQIVQDFVNNPATASYFDDYGLWGELGKQDLWGEDVSDANHTILTLLATTSDGVTISEIQAKLHKEVAGRSLAALTERGIISISDENGRYHITFGLFHDWIRLHK
jgi:tetratricopeptide (TPR) repeat protein